MINAGGYRISPLEIEAVLDRHPWVRESAVVGLELDPGKSIVAAFVVAEDKVLLTRENSESILQFAKDHLAAYKCPRQIVFLKTLAKTSNGKIQRKALKA